MPAISKDIASPVSPRLKLVYGFMKSYGECSAQGLLSLYSDKKFTLSTFPSSLNQPIRSKAETAAYYEKILPRLKTHQFLPWEIIEAEEKIVVLAGIRGETILEKPFYNECVLVFGFDGPVDDPRIASITEFVDSQASKSIFTRRKSVEEKLRTRL
ncbi:hypothetical protein SISSUDRAFT_1042137 [Sistotremastrum suecicum HHB10207 ss-3]|uniref:SnoaL-like domain-containing protein n=1 Tax=Sistotremastrum suecicum HHB10207 ss-3 TaxID=1314776 RepID=A0A166GQM2_9AGAM|nr:hypothetical protein SISSUDRAFT_1042137 [Sistotremastrum suecicum HHB10207 ss-3]